ncbi:Integrator complex subunit 12, partial [Stegodyphus mimosarum]
MASTELDPLFVKGLRLLHSKSRESADQLKMLLDDAIAQSKQSAHVKIYTSVKMEGESKLHLKKTLREVPEISNFSSKHSIEENRERKAEKRQLEKAKQESVDMLEAKIPKLESQQVFSYYPPSPDLPPKLDQYVLKKDEDTDSSDENADADDFAMEMGLACVICKQIEVTQGNQLIECQECHSLYHQECHRPPATDYDVNDPRRVWYCAKCMKNMKKMATKTQKTAKSGATVPPKEPIVPTKCTKNEGSPPALILPFKRTELKPNLSQGSTIQTANKPTGLASLAANFGSRTTVSSTTSSLTVSTRGVKPATPTLNLKTPFSSASVTKTSLTSSSTLLSKGTVPSNTFQSLPLTTTSQSVVTATSQKTLTTSSSAKGLGLLSAAVASTSGRNVTQVPSGNGNSGHKVASCSPLMSADKRLQIMKKKASKLQEKRRLSTK